jgi:hypothetical protein
MTARLDERLITTQDSSFKFSAYNEPIVVEPPLL